MAIGGALATVLETWLDRAQGILRLGRQLVPSIGPGSSRMPGDGETPRAPVPTPAELARFGGPAPTSHPRRAVTGVPTDALPQSYGYDHVALLPRDPWSAFAYWEVTPASLTDALRRLGLPSDRAQPVLRLYEVGAEEQTTQVPLRWSDIDVPPGVESWHVRLPHPDASYFVEIGIRTPGNQIIAFARSAVMTAPPSAPARDEGATWLPPGAPVTRD